MTGLEVAPLHSYIIHSSHQNLLTANHPIKRSNKNKVLQKDLEKSIPLSTTMVESIDKSCEYELSLHFVHLYEGGSSQFFFVIVIIIFDDYRAFFIPIKLNISSLSWLDSSWSCVVECNSKMKRTIGLSAHVNNTSWIVFNEDLSYFNSDIVEWEIWQSTVGSILEFRMMMVCTQIEVTRILCHHHSTLSGSALDYSMILL